jgi:hypothetical protein
MEKSIVGATLERTFKRAYHLNANFSLAEIKSSQSLLRERTYNFTRRCGAWREKTPLAMNQISHFSFVKYVWRVKKWKNVCNEYAKRDIRFSS